MVTSLPSFSLSLSLCISLSLSHRMYLTHNIGSASALPIIWTQHWLALLFPFPPHQVGAKNSQLHFWNIAKKQKRRRSTKKKFIVRQTASSGKGMRERERRGGGGEGEGGSGVTRDELENELPGRSTLSQRHRCADLPSSWRLTSTRTHSLPRTLVFRGFTANQLGSSSLTLGPPAETAFMLSHGHQRSATSGR